jgi:hypothetical protein
MVPSGHRMIAAPGADESRVPMSSKVTVAAGSSRTAFWPRAKTVTVLLRVFRQMERSDGVHATGPDAPWNLIDMMSLMAVARERGRIGCRMRERRSASNASAAMYMSADEFASCGAPLAADWKAASMLGHVIVCMVACTRISSSRQRCIAGQS